MNDRQLNKKIIGMTKKLPQGHNIGGGNRQKRRSFHTFTLKPTN